MAYSRRSSFRRPSRRSYVPRRRSSRSYSPRRGRSGVSRSRPASMRIEIVQVPAGPVARPIGLKAPPPPKKAKF